MTGSAVNVAELPRQTGFAETEIETPTGTLWLTIIVTGAERAGLPVAHVRFDKRAQVITSPVEGVKLKLVLFVPTLSPLTIHWYVGKVPPFTAVAVYVTTWPWQDGFDDAEMLTDTAKLELTIMLIWFETTVDAVIQLALLVS